MAAIATVPLMQTWVTGEIVDDDDMNGQVRDPANFLLGRIGCNVYNSSNQSLTAGTLTRLSFDSENWDNDGMHSTVTNTSRVTVNTPGTWRFDFYVQWASGATSPVQMNLRKNSGGSPTGGSSMRLISTNADTATTNRIWTLEQQLSAGEYVELFACAGNASTANLGSNVTGVNAVWVST